MIRIVVVGGFGYFGSVLIEQLRSHGLTPLIASRRSAADVIVDVEDPDSIRQVLGPCDLVIDAAGPFQQRSTCLVTSAIEIGFDLIDLNDSLAYGRAIRTLKPQIDATNIRVFTACSAMSAVSAAVLRISDCPEPVRITGFLVPATRTTAVEGTAASLFASVGTTIQIFTCGRLAEVAGWSSRSFAMPAPIGTRVGYLFESVDAITLPAVWPSLESVQFFVDTNVRGLNSLFRLAARFSMVRAIIGKCQRPGLRLARLLGRSMSGLGYEIEGSRGETVRVAFTAPHRGYLTAVAPATLVALKLIDSKFDQRGLITPDRHIEPDELVQYLNTHGVSFSIDRQPSRSTGSAEFR